VSATEEVLAAAADLVEAFGRHDTSGYFACFAPDATFVFHTAEQPLRSRADYEALWASWERDDGFRVEGCASTDQHVQHVSDDVAVFTHRVATRVRTDEAVEEVDERETIVFVRRGHGWVAVHEHLSPVT
jgi:ketosteroid isomerase-like protein